MSRPSAANGAASTSRFLTHWRGRIALIDSRWPDCSAALPRGELPHSCGSPVSFWSDGGADRLGHDGADGNSGQHVARVVHAEYEAGQRHWRHQEPRQGKSRRPAEQNRGRGGRRGVRRGEAQPAGRGDVHGDRRMMRAFPLHDALDDDGRRVGDERAETRGQPDVAAVAAAAARRAATPRPTPRCARRSVTTPARREARLGARRGSTARRRAPRPRPAGCLSPGDFCGGSRGRATGRSPTSACWRARAGLRGRPCASC